MNGPSVFRPEGAGVNSQGRALGATPRTQGPPARRPDGEPPAAAPPRRGARYDTTRNAGARAAHGGMFVFIDADTVVTGGAVAAAVGAMRRGAAGGGCAVRFDGRLPLYGRILAGVVGPLCRMFGVANGCFLFCTRE